MSIIYHTPISFGAPIDTSVVNARLSQLDTAIAARAGEIAAVDVLVDNLVAGAQGFTQLNLGTATTLTIDAGAVTVVKSRHLVDTQAAAATDDLTTINGSVEGDYLTLQIVSAARVVTIKHNAGNIYLAHEGDIVLDDVRKAVTLYFDGTKWIQNFSFITVKDRMSGVETPLATLTFPRSIIRSSGAGAGNNAPLIAVVPSWEVRNWWGERAAAATYAQVGIAAGTNAGAGAVTNANDANSTFVSQAIAASSGTFGGRRSTTFDLVRRAHNPHFVAVIKTGNPVTNIRFYVGLFSAMVTNVDTIAGATEAAAIRYSSVAGDAGWMGVTKDATTQSTPVSTGVGIAVDTVYKLEVRIDSSNGIAYFSVNGSAEVSINSNLPVAATDLGFVVTAITTTATAKSINISRIWCDYD